MLRQGIGIGEGRAPEVKDVIAIHQTALTVHSQHAVGIAIEAKPISAPCSITAWRRAQVGAAATHIDGRTIWLAVQGNHLSTKTPKQGLRAGGG